MKPSWSAKSEAIFNLPHLLQNFHRTSVAVYLTRDGPLTSLFRVSNPYVANMIYKFYYGKKHLISWVEPAQDLDTAIMSCQIVWESGLACMRNSDEV
jgi:hypothetical protein